MIPVNRFGWLLLCLFAAGCDLPSPRRKNLADNPHRTTPNQERISVLAWNVESGGSDPAVIASQLAELAGYDVYCLSEVDANAFARYVAALGPDFVAVNSVTGGNDRLQIIYDSNRLEALQQKELQHYGEHELNDGRHRSPLFVRLRDRQTGVQFIVMTNHLARRDADLRTQQAVGLREWARDQNVAVINIGDFNLDFDFHSQRGNEAFSEMLRDNIWLWVKPTKLVDTNWADPDGDGRDNYPDSMLDFAFVAGPAKEWKPVSRVIVQDGDFPDDDSTSDHRPIELVLTP